MVKVLQTAATVVSSSMAHLLWRLVWMQKSVADPVLVTGSNSRALPTPTCDCCNAITEIISFRATKSHISRCQIHRINWSLAHITIFSLATIYWSSPQDSNTKHYFHANFPDAYELAAMKVREIIYWTSVLLYPLTNSQGKGRHFLRAISHTSLLLILTSKQNNCVSSVLKCTIMLL